MSSSTDVNGLVFVKNGDRYIFMFRDDQSREMLMTFGRLASNPDLNFSWYDAASMSQRLRIMMTETDV